MATHPLRFSPQAAGGALNEEVEIDDDDDADSEDKDFIDDDDDEPEESGGDDDDVEDDGDDDEEALQERRSGKTKAARRVRRVLDTAYLLSSHLGLLRAGSRTAAGAAMYPCII